ncbi:DUF4956 domain-containing protein [Rarobacter incanus]|uniref:Uncharacterized protein DUF4956 n=1 Tax=Rarobacter incanus TaxID=153494 RepID=A0A542SL72_9MICO|nr:DUF4956 domain-containing protein [Rarobacter incanus]TQK75386.1 uncharacterized protein DUF4956 [Rarobacter incanus]
MATLTMIAADIVAITVLTFAMYFRRHRRRDLVVAFLGVNIGVLAVAIELGQTSVGMGLGLGLFGVLSIIRLRSTEISQREVAYYFSALALGLIAGLTTAVNPVTLALMAAIVAVMWIGDSPKMLRGYRSQVVVLDHVYSGRTRIAAALEELLDADIEDFTVQKTDTVNDSMIVEVRYRTRPEPARGSLSDPEEAALARLAGRPGEVAR